MRIFLTKLKLSMTILAAILLICVGTIACSGISNSSVTLEEQNNQVVSTAVHVAAVGLGQTLKNITDENQRIKLIQDFIDPIRFFKDSSGYFFVYYYNCINLAHAIDKTLPGKDLSNYKDSKGMLVIQELSKTAKSGGGFVTFYWPHPETKVEQKKIGYVEPIPGTDYFIGAGYYPDTK